MTVELLTLSDRLTDSAASPRVYAIPGEQGGVIRRSISRTTATGTTTTSGSTFLTNRLPADAVLVYGTIRSDATNAPDLPDLDVGLRHVAGDGTITLSDGAFCTALDVDDVNPHDWFGGNNQAGTLVALDRSKALWEHLGLTSDPGGYIDIHVSTDTDNVVAGVFEVEVWYVVD